MQDEPKNPGEDRRGEPTNGISEEDKTIQENLITVVNNNSVSISRLLDDQFAPP